MTLAVLAAVVAALIHGRLRSDVVALTGAALLLLTGVVRPVEVQAAFASPAIVALASLFVIAFAMELNGLLDSAIRGVVSLCRRIGRAGLWILIALAGGASAFLNNTPIVVLSAPVEQACLERTTGGGAHQRADLVFTSNQRRQKHRPAIPRGRA